MRVSSLESEKVKWEDERGSLSWQNLETVRVGTIGQRDQQQLMYSPCSFLDSISGLVLISNVLISC